MKLTPVIVVVVIGALLAMPGTVMPQSQKKRTIVLGEDFAKARVTPKAFANSSLDLNAEGVG